jgi:hypothetical protein
LNLHFGFNCQNYIPSLGKCRLAIKEYQGQSDLQDHRWVTVKEALIYLDVPGDELLGITDSADIKPVKKGLVPVRLRIKETWAWDGCPLSLTGGQCGVYEEHDGPKVSCASDIERLAGKHPNVASEPGIDVVERCERELIRKSQNES